MQLKQALSYDDILLVPQYSDIGSRTEICIENELDQQKHASELDHRASKNLS